MNKLRFPIGGVIKPINITNEILQEWISDITAFPERLKNEVILLTSDQLDTKYRPNGWSIRQVVHHCADSHMNSFIRFKLGLTENKPIIKPYLEEKWAEQIDEKEFQIESSLMILEGLHQRWAILLNNLSSPELSRTFIHPADGKEHRLDESIGNYAWHCNHHLAQIISLKKRKKWSY